MKINGKELSKILILILVISVTACQKVLVEEAFKGVDPAASVDLHVQAAMAYLNKKRPSDARRHAANALKIEPKSAVALNAMALIYKYELDDEKEEHYYKKAINADGEFSPARNNYAVLLFKHGKYKSALRQLNYVVADTGYAKRASAFENIGRCEVELGQMDKAELSFKRALRLNPNQSGALLELAWLSYLKGDYTQSEQYHSKMKKLVRQNPRSLLLAIKLAGNKGDRNAAFSSEMALKNLYPDSPEYKLFLESENGK